MKPFLPLLCLGLAACGNAGAVPVPPNKLTPPNARLMAPVKDLPPIAESDSIYDHAAMCRAEYGRVASQVKGLQNWAVVVTRTKRN